jgi:putative DNA-invertase from lambdoid prophage Rac
VIACTKRHLGLALRSGKLFPCGAVASTARRAIGINCNAFAGENGPTSRRVQLGQIALYCRVSTDDQSCERQERDLRAFAKRAGHKIVAVFKETASGAKNDRIQRKKAMALAQAHEIDAILVTELSRWGRSTQDLVQTLDDLHGWKVSVLAQTGLTFDLSTSSGKLMRAIMAGLAEFERDLIRERVKSGLAAARSRGVQLGRREGQRPSDKKAKKVLAQHAEGLSYRLIGRNLGLSKNTVMDIVRRETAGGG